MCVCVCVCVCACACACACVGLIPAMQLVFTYVFLQRLLSEETIMIFHVDIPLKPNILKSQPAYYTTHTHTHARTHARTHERTHARTHKYRKSLLEHSLVLMNNNMKKLIKILITRTIFEKDYGL